MWLAISVMICYRFPLTSEFMCYIYNICSFMFRYSGPTYFITCFTLPNMWYSIPIVCFFNYQPIHLTTTQSQMTMLLPTWPSDPPQCGLCQAPTHSLHLICYTSWNPGLPRLSPVQAAFPALVPVLTLPSMWDVYLDYLFGLCLLGSFLVLLRQHFFEKCH